MFEVHQDGIIVEQVKSLIDGERDLIANLSNVSALLNQLMEDINWVGFYLMKNGELVLGPFQGKVACIRIPVGRGVCGTAVAEGKTQLIKDVHSFEGHIACDSASRSEIVIPIKVGDKIMGVLDIDSPSFGRFDETDQALLEEVVNMLVVGCEW